MRLALSSAAAPDLDLRELLGICQQRGIADLELVAGDAHGVGPGLTSRGVASLRREIDAHEIRLAALHLPDAQFGIAVEMARLSIAFGVPLVAPVSLVRTPVMLKVSTIIAAEGGRVLLLHSTAEAAAVRDESAGSRDRHLGFAWQVNPLQDDLGAAADILADLAGDVAYIRLLGSGPETAQCSGRGLGGLMGRLALTRYREPLVLAPSTPRYHYAWSAWLGRKGGWGCGSAASGRAIHTLQHA